MSLQPVKVMVNFEHCPLDTADPTCSVCYEPYDMGDKLRFGHRVSPRAAAEETTEKVHSCCLECLKEWFVANTTCPLCRVTVTHLNGKEVKAQTTALQEALQGAIQEAMTRQVTSPGQEVLVRAMGAETLTSFIGYASRELAAAMTPLIEAQQAARAAELARREAAQRELRELREQEEGEQQRIDLHYLETWVKHDYASIREHFLQQARPSLIRKDPRNYYGRLMHLAMDGGKLELIEGLLSDQALIPLRNAFFLNAENRALVVSILGHPTLQLDVWRQCIQPLLNQRPSQTRELREIFIQHSSIPARRMLLANTILNEELSSRWPECVRSQAHILQMTKRGESERLHELFLQEELPSEEITETMAVMTLLKGHTADLCRVLSLRPISKDGWDAIRLALNSNLNFLAQEGVSFRQLRSIVETAVRLNDLEFLNLITGQSPSGPSIRPMMRGCALDLAMTQGKNELATGLLSGWRFRDFREMVGLFLEEASGRVFDPSILHHLHSNGRHPVRIANSAPRPGPAIIEIKDLAPHLDLFMAIRSEAREVSPEEICTLPSPAKVAVAYLCAYMGKRSLLEAILRDLHPDDILTLTVISYLSPHNTLDVFELLLNNPEVSLSFLRQLPRNETLNGAIDRKAAAQAQLLQRRQEEQKVLGERRKVLAEGQKELQQKQSAQFMLSMAVATLAFLIFQAFSKSQNP